jgi:cell division protein FtsL
MTQISIAARPGAVRDPFASDRAKSNPLRSEQRPIVVRPLIGKPLSGAGIPATGGSIRDTYLREEIEEDEQESPEEPTTAAIPGMRAAQPETLEKVVKRIPTLYVIAFFGVVVMCAVSIIWNTLQVNRLTLEKTRANDRIAQTEQRLIKLRAQEMQLSAPSRIRALAKDKLGMIEETGSEVVIVKQQ